MAVPLLHVGLTRVLDFCDSKTIAEVGSVEVSKSVIPKQRSKTKLSCLIYHISTKYLVLRVVLENFSELRHMKITE